MLIDKEDLKRRLESPRNLCVVLQPLQNNCVVTPMHPGGKKVGDKNIPDFVKKTVGVLAKMEPAKDVAGIFGISENSVQKQKRSKDPEIAAAVNQTTNRIRDIALDKLMASLGLINDESLSGVSAKDASLVARNLATVVDKLSPRDAVASQTTLLIYAPRQRSEENYKTIDCKAE